MTLEEKLNHFMEISVQDATMEMDASLKEYQAALDAQFEERSYDSFSGRERSCG